MKNIHIPIEIDGRYVRKSIVTSLIAFVTGVVVFLATVDGAYGALVKLNKLSDFVVKEYGSPLVSKALDFADSTATEFEELVSRNSSPSGDTDPPPAATLLDSRSIEFNRTVQLDSTPLRCRVKATKLHVRTYPSAKNERGELHTQDVQRTLFGDGQTFVIAYRIKGDSNWFSIKSIEYKDSVESAKVPWYVTLWGLDHDNCDELPS